jgi:hypothetical protein
MDSFGDLASAARDVVRAGGCENVPYRLELDTPVPADDIGDEGEFPQYGYFADVTALDENGDELGARWLETPADLGRQLDDLDVEEGDAFQIIDASKDDTDSWTFNVALWAADG